MTTLLKAEPKRCALVVVVLLSVLLTGGHAEQCGSQAGGGLCANNLCCSQYGWCGSTSAYCGTGCQSQCGTTSNGRCGSQGGGATCANNLCCSQYGYCGSTTDYCGAGCESQCTPTSGTPPTSDVSSIISSSTFSAFFPYMNSFYSYNAFITAANSFAGFGTSGSSVYQKREVAAFLANVKQETGGLQYIREISPGSKYCDSSNTQYPCASGKSYYGRGPLQLSWNYNYGAAGSYLGLNLLNNPDLLEQDSGASFKASLWFWMQSPSSSSSCHQAIVGGSGFGQTIRIINGGYECGQGTETAAASNRISYYQDLCSRLGVDPGTNLGCA